MVLGMGMEFTQTTTQCGKKNSFKKRINCSHLLHKLLLDGEEKHASSSCSQCLRFLAHPYLGNSVCVVQRVNLSNFLLYSRSSQDGGCVLV